MTVGFVHLRVRSAFSLLEGALRLKDIVRLAAADTQPAIAVTDRANLFGALEFSEKAADAGVQPIIGCELPVDFGEPVDARGRSDQSLPSIVLLARTPVGYANLVKLVSRAYLDGGHGGGVATDLQTLAELSTGLIALTGWREGPLGDALARERTDLATERLGALATSFPEDLYVEIQRHPEGRTGALEAPILDLAYRAGLPIVATNDAHFAAADDHGAHEALLAIADGTRLSDEERRTLTPDHRLKTRAEMVELFADLPEALENTIEIARRCHARPLKAAPMLPGFATGAEASGEDRDAVEARLLEEMAREGLERRLAIKGAAPGTGRDAYESRLAEELGIITRMNYQGYFLIVSDFIQWAKKAGIPVGPGRGSGAGSLVAYALTITDLDPLEFDLLFERFLNPERVSMPDFDVDFCQDRRDEVIGYVAQKYGADRVAQIITFGTLQARAVLRDVGRVLDLPYGKVDRLCKLVPANPSNPVTLAQAVEGEPRLQEAMASEPVVDRLVSVSLKLEGLYRHASTHAAGIVIGDRPLEDVVPLYRDPRSELPVTQFNMKWVENAGLVKFDFLGLKTLTLIDKAIALIARKDISIDLETLPLDDDKTYQMLSRGETVGVFQLESQGMRKALVGMKPDRFEDIIALVALYRPGPMDNIPTYNRRKHGQEEPEYLHPILEPILKETYGVIIYQEQVMQIAQVMSGYSLGEADLLRRAMGKKIKAEMDVQRERFVVGAREQGVDGANAERIFDLVAKFANYGFNKSHAAAYALVAYQTAYLKANFLCEFLAASMTLDMGNTDKLNEFRREAMRLGIEVVPPSVTTSGIEFDVRDDRIIYALSAIKGFGRQAAQHIVDVRNTGACGSLEDFVSALNPRIATRRGLEALVCAGAFDTWDGNRARLFAGLDLMIASAQRSVEMEEAGQTDIFGASTEKLPLPATRPWPPTEKLQREFAAVGFYLSAHPLDLYRSVLERSGVRWWNEFVGDVKRGATAGRLAATVTSRQERRTRTGNRMGIVGLSDPTAQYEAVLFSEGLAQYRDLLEPGNSVLVVLNAEEREDGVSARIQSVEPLDEVAKRDGKRLTIFLDEGEALPDISGLLKRKGSAEVSLVMLLSGGREEVEVALGRDFEVSPPLAGAIKALPGVIDARLA